MFTLIRKYNFWDGQTIQEGFLRNAYLDRIQKYYGSDLVKVILGQRRAGKSYIMRMLMSRLLKDHQVGANNILYLNMDLQPLSFIQNSSDLLQIIETYRAELKPQGRVYLFIDEVQEIEGWEKAINSLSQDYTQPYDIFITGSNANLLSQELGTYLSGRFVSFEVFPFSYQEYLDFNKISRNKQSLLDYMRLGGLPENYRLTDDEMRENYTSSLKDSILMRDIVGRYNIRDVNLLKTLANFAADSIGSLFSIQSIVKYLISHRHKTNVETIGNYLNYLAAAYYIHACDRYDIKGRQILLGEKKYYLNDLAFKYLLTSSFDKNFSRYLENLIYIDLKRQGYTVYVGQIRDKEVDFVAERNGEKIYVQVCYLLSDEQVIEREFNNLKLISDNYPKYVISLDDITFKNQEGIQHIQAWNFLS